MGLIAIVTLGVAAEFTSLARPDMAFLLYAARRVLDGARLYVDVIEINPPLIVALNMPAVLLARLVGIGDILAYRVLVTGALLSALAFSAWSLRWSADLGGGNFRRRFVLVLAFALFLAAGDDFGQREHLLTALALPYALLAVGRAKGRPAPRSRAFAAGVFAGMVSPSSRTSSSFWQPSKATRCGEAGSGAFHLRRSGRPRSWSCTSPVLRSSPHNILHSSGP